jgi:hypothetical protein
MLGTLDNNARIRADVVLLADGEVILIGGGRGTGSQSAEEYQCPIFIPEVFDLDTETWTALTNEQHSIPRVYHSMAVLLTDGSVWTTGQDTSSTCPTGPPGCPTCPIQVWPLGDREVEIYRPWYVFDVDRPEVTDAPPPDPTEALERNSTFEVEYSLGSGRSFEWVALIAPSAVTHSTNMTQRYVILNNENPSGNKVEVEVPPAKYAPPGPYMLVVVDDEGSASEARWIYLE